MTDSARYAEVVLPVPVSRAYTYQIPDALADRVVCGARVVVPVRRGAAVGIVTAVVSDQPSAVSDIKAIVAAPDDQPALSPALLGLARWISDYYGAPLGLALRAILPGPLWRVSRPEGPAEATERVLVLTGRVESLLERERVFKRTPKRRAAYEAVEALGGSAPLPHLVDRLKLSASALDGLVRQGLARVDTVTETRDPFADLSSPPPPRLTADQQRVVAAITGAPSGTPVLIHGVTGSGKTLVYLEVLRDIVASGAGAIVLVPEIALTPQTVARVRGVFGDQVAVLHSGLSDGERVDAWRALRRGERRVAVGPRSAVFAPVQRLGAIVVDEEHDPSSKQGSAPRYHAREAAVERARPRGRHE
jgi:primosomal protein N' (replication factor Y)